MSDIIMQAQAWSVVFDLCVELGMNPCGHGSGQDLVCKFIRDLVEKEQNASSNYKIPIKADE